MSSDTLIVRRHGPRASVSDPPAQIFALLRTLNRPGPASGCAPDEPPGARSGPTDGSHFWKSFGSLFPAVCRPAADGSFVVPREPYGGNYSVRRRSLFSVHLNNM